MAGRRSRSALGWWRRRSLRLRLTLLTTLALAAFFAGGGILLVRSLKSSLLTALDTTASARAADVAAAVAQGRVTDPLPTTGNGATQVQVVDAVGRVVAATPGTDRQVVLGTGTGRAAPFRLDGRLLVPAPAGDGPPLLVVTRPAGAGLVVVGVSAGEVVGSVEGLARALFVGVPVLLVLLAGTTWLVVGATLRPVTALRRGASEISGSERRLPQPLAYDEVGQLAETLNGMLARLEEAGSRERAFVADAAHELRSPLAGMRAQLEVALAHPDPAAWEQTASAVLDDVLRLGRLVEDLLALARLDARERPERRELLDLVEVVRRGVPPGVGLSVTGAVRVLGDGDALLRVVRNLVDNALRYTRTPVQVEVGVEGTRARVVVSDDGPGVPAAQRERVFVRFARLDDDRSRAAGGAGLGLAIAREIVRGHGGEVAFADAPIGATVVLTLPLAGRPGVLPQ